MIVSPLPLVDTVPDLSSQKFVLRILCMDTVWNEIYTVMWDIVRSSQQDVSSVASRCEQVHRDVTTHFPHPTTSVKSCETYSSVNNTKLTESATGGGSINQHRCGKPIGKPLECNLQYKCIQMVGVPHLYTLVYRRVTPGWGVVYHWLRWLMLLW